MNKKLLIILIFCTLPSIFVAIFYPYNRNNSTDHSQHATPIPSGNSSPRKATLLFTGDLMMDRYIRQMAMNYGSYDMLFEDITTVLTNADLVISNLEGPITNRPSVSVNSAIGSPENYMFTFSPDILPSLIKNNIRAVNIGNNHIMNQGFDGLKSTLSFLSEANIAYFGNPHSEFQNERTYKTVLNDISIGLVNFNEFTSNAKIALEEDLEKLKPETDILIVFAHWGPEYMTKSPAYIQNLAKEWIISGADFVVGSHPHVVMEKESYMGKTIYYSIGNFIMDQYFSYDTTHGLLVKMNIVKNNSSILYSTEEYPIFMETTGKTKLINNHLLESNGSKW